jgi:hypothetical protein
LLRSAAASGGTVVADTPRVQHCVAVQCVVSGHCGAQENQDLREQQNRADGKSAYALPHLMTPSQLCHSTQCEAAALLSHSLAEYLLCKPCPTAHRSLPSRRYPTARSRPAPAEPIPSHPIPSHPTFGCSVALQLRRGSARPMRIRLSSACSRGASIRELEAAHAEVVHALHTQIERLTADLRRASARPVDHVSHSLARTGQF